MLIRASRSGDDAVSVAERALGVDDQPAVNPVEDDGEVAEEVVPDETSVS